MSTLQEVDDPEVEDYYIKLNKHLPFHYNVEGDEDVQSYKTDRAIEDDAERVRNDPEEGDDNEAIEDDEDMGVSSGMSPVQKLRAICKKIISSPQHRAAFRTLAHKYYADEKTEKGTDISKLMPIRDVKTRWNYMHAMIVRALQLKKGALMDPLTAINVWVLDQDELQDLYLSPGDWASLKQLGDLLEIFTKVTATMSKARTPTLPWVLPMYEYMRKYLDKQIKNNSLPLALCEAIAAGLEKLLHYYNLALECQYAVIATICHPSLHIDWFDELSDDRRAKAWALFEHVYNDYKASEPEIEDVPQAALVDEPSDFLTLVAKKSKPAANNPML
ncbi:hypothetical protein EWM64_g5750 [Hericium alpestre]|uniref:hAT-like transposase RNase-H fold domain-containing protein n=1 Tax=Hericium alpestre TaxID=135208 RepID=A0A4Y9ZVR1_9AGAM|nr:hypothetical protein EWM64_g5750 [Hericium alpestre]